MDVEKRFSYFKDASLYAKTLAHDKKASVRVNRNDDSWLVVYNEPENYATSLNLSSENELRDLSDPSLKSNKKHTNDQFDTAVNNFDSLNNSNSDYWEIDYDPKNWKVEFDEKKDTYYKRQIFCRANSLGINGNKVVFQFNQKLLNVMTKISIKNRIYLIGYHKVLGLTIFDPFAQEGIDKSQVRLYKAEEHKMGVFAEGVIELLRPIDDRLDKSFENHSFFKQKTFTAMVTYDNARINARFTHCYKCKGGLDSMNFAICGNCGWIICRCGACGCNFWGKSSDY